MAINYVSDYGITLKEFKNNPVILQEIQEATMSTEGKLTRLDSVKKLYKDLQSSIPRAEVAKHVEYVHDRVPTAVGVGSFRRGCKYSRDIDILVREPIDIVLSKLGKYVVDVVTKGNVKAMIVVRLGRHGKHRLMDILRTTSTSYPFAVLYMTGSKQFNIVMRMKAKRLGMKLNEIGLFKNDEMVPGLVTEKDVFAALGMDYIQPKDRTSDAMKIKNKAKRAAAKKAK